MAKATKTAPAKIEYAGHRYRVTRMLELSGGGPPRRGPRMPVRDYRAF